MANTIYRGPAEREPETITLPVGGPFYPGTVVTYSNGTTAVSATAAALRWGILCNNRFIGQSIQEPFATGDTVSVYRVEGEQEYYARMEAGSYNAGQELTIGTGGAFKAAATGNRVVATFDEQKARTLSAVGFGDIVILSTPYVK